MVIISFFIKSAESQQHPATDTRQSINATDSENLLDLSMISGAFWWQLKSGKKSNLLKVIPMLYLHFSVTKRRLQTRKTEQQGKWYTCSLSNFTM